LPARADNLAFIYPRHRCPMNLTANALSLVALAQLAPSPTASPAVTEPRVLAPPPAPPAPPRPGTPAYDQERAYRAGRLRETCISERGIRTIMESQDQSRAVAVASGEGRSIEQELGQAAHADPLDLDRLERALASRAAYQAAQQARRDREAISMLRRLSPEDRAIHARQLTPMMVFPLRQPCSSRP